MRATLLLPFLILAACSESSQAPEKAEPAAAEHIKAGQWEMAIEVTKVTQRDKGAPALKMPVGTKLVTSSCVTEAEVKQPPAGLFVPEGFKCEKRDTYVRGGRINLTLECTRDGLSGDIPIVINGNYTAEGIEATSTAETRLTGDGDVMMESKLAGRRTGACSAAAPKS